ncbi:MAG TPA: MATE family efflux transporter [Candidatus Ozemobacteraceae bacterium]|nr:MATE family efflux transporter [Candidatus Ozemobacteraceae bacterium]
MSQTPQATSEPRSGTDLSVGSIPRHLITFSIPLLMGSLIQTAYGVINAIWVGHGLGPQALGAVTCSFPVTFLFIAVSGGLTMGASILVSQRYGARDYDGVRTVVQTAFWLTLLVAALCFTAGQLLVDRPLHLMQTPAEILPLASSYLKLYLCTTPSMFLLFLLVSALRGTGDARTPLRYQFWALLATAVLDPFLMFGWLGLPRFGLNGTAIAAIVCQIGSVVLLYHELHRRRHLVSPDLRQRNVDGPTARQMLRIGIPSMIQQGLVSVGMLVIISMVNTFGKDATAAFGAASRFDQVTFLPAMTIGMATASLAGQNIGAGKFDRVRQTFRWAAALSVSITFPAACVAYFFPDFILGLFISDPVVTELGRSYLRIIAPGSLFFSIMFASNGVINGAGHTIATTFFTLIGMWIVRVPLAWWLSHRWNSVDGVWWGITLGFIGGMFTSLGYYLLGRWQKPTRATPPRPSS